MRHLAVPLLIVFACAGDPRTATAVPATPDASPATTEDPWKICKPAIAAAERSAKIPRHLMLSIALVESGRRNDGPSDGRNDGPSDGRAGVEPWPWTINAEGAGRFFETKTDAIAAVRDLRGREVRSVDVGCMQVNLHYHPKAFPDLEAAFDPAANAAFAARFLRSLFQDTGSWMHAVARYHSSIYRNNRQYMIRVMKTWRRLGGGQPRPRP